MNYWWLMLFLIVELRAQHSLRKLPHPVNTAYYNEICPVFALDEKTLFYTRVGSPAFNKTLIYDNQDLHTTLSTDAYFDRLAAIFLKLQEGRFRIRSIPATIRTSTLPWWKRIPCDLPTIPDIRLTTLYPTAFAR